MSGRHLVPERTAHRLRLALDHLDESARGAGRPARAELPFAHSADAGADDGGELALRQAELVPRLARIGIARGDAMHDHAGFLAGDEIAQLVQAGEEVVGQPASFYFLRHDAMISFRSLASSFLSRAVRSAFSFFAYSTMSASGKSSAPGAGDQIAAGRIK